MIKKWLAVFVCLCLLLLIFMIAPILNSNSTGIYQQTSWVLELLYFCNNNFIYIKNPIKASGEEKIQRIVCEIRIRLSGP